MEPAGIVHGDNMSVTSDNQTHINGNLRGRNDSDYSPEDFDEIIKNYKNSLLNTDDPVTIVLIGCYVLVFVFALCGNLIVLLVILTNRNMRRSITNSYLLNLAIADLLVTVVCIPPTVGEKVYKAWIFGFFLCKATSYLQGVCVSASVLTIMALSLDRYVAIRHPVRSRQTSSAACVRITIAGIWVVSGIIMVPLAIVRSLSNFALHTDNVDLAMCVELWPSPTTRTAFDTFLFVFIYIIPGMIVIFSYSSTGCRLMAGDHRLQRTDSDVCHSSKVRAGRRRLARMLLVLAILFALSWMPYHAISLYLDYGSLKEISDLENFLSFSLLLGHSHSAQNPVLYCFMNTSFKRGFRVMLKCGQTPSASNSLVRRDTWRGATRRTTLGSRRAHDNNGNHHNVHNNAPNGTGNFHINPTRRQSSFKKDSGGETCQNKLCVKTPFLSSTKKGHLEQEDVQSTEMTPLSPVFSNTAAIKNYID